MFWGMEKDQVERREERKELCFQRPGGSKSLGRIRRKQKEKHFQIERKEVNGVGVVKFGWEEGIQFCLDFHR